MHNGDLKRWIICLFVILLNSAIEAYFLYSQFHPIININTNNVVFIDNRRKHIHQVVIWRFSLAFDIFLSNIIFIHFMHQLSNDFTFSYMPFWDFRNDLTQTFGFEKSHFKWISKAPIIYKYSKSLRINLIAGIYGVSSRYRCGTTAFKKFKISTRDNATKQRNEKDLISKLW